MIRIGVDAIPIIRVRGGVGYYIDRILTALIRQRPDDEFVLYSLRSGPDLERYRAFANVRIRVAPVMTISEVVWGETVLPLLLMQDRPDVFWGGAQFMPLVTPPRTRTILTIHDFVYYVLPSSMGVMRRHLLRHLGGFMYRHADALVSNSFGTDDRLHHYYGLRSDAIVPPPIARPLIDVGGDPTAVLARHGLTPGQYLIFSGTLEPRKNLPALLRAYGAIAGVIGTEQMMKLVLVGGSGWNNRDLLDHLGSSEARLGENILRLGFVEERELQSLVAGARALVLPSVYEGYGMPLAEARSLGTDVICTDSPETREAAGYQGFFVGSEEALGQTLRLVMQDPTLRPAAAERAADWVDAATAATRMSALIDRLLR